MIRISLVALIIFLFQQAQAQDTVRYEASHPNFQYVGRIDFTNPAAPRFWSPGVYITATFQGDECYVLINDEQLWGKHNYVSVAIDNLPARRIKLSGKTNKIKVAGHLDKGKHQLTICKSTESNIGYIEFAGLVCQRLLKPVTLPNRRIEFIGNSITCGTGSDQSTVKCGQGDWHDQHNAYMSYGPLTARALKAQWMLTAVSGIGLIHSCCKLDITMPVVFDKVNLGEDSLLWDFRKYQPDVVTICLGQNDGIQDSTAFCSAYVKFIVQVKKVYPKTMIILLTSPMADENLLPVLKRYINGIVSFENKNGNANVKSYFFSRRFNNGCDDHPDLQEHQMIADELAQFIGGIMNWRLQAER
jgi:hypothetical protein